MMMTGIEIINVKPADDEHVLTQFYVSGKRCRSTFDAWISFWSDPPVVKNLHFFTRNNGIKEKLIDSDAAITKIFACLKAGCKIKMAVIICKRFNCNTVSDSRFNLKLVGTEVILEPIA